MQRALHNQAAAAISSMAATSTASRATAAAPTSASRAERGRRRMRRRIGARDGRAVHRAGHKRSGAAEGPGRRRDRLRRGRRHVDTALPGQDEIIGIAPALAARIQSEAAPNSVAVAEATYRLTRALRVRADRGPGAEGFCRASTVVAAAGPPAASRSLHRLPARTAPLIGREDELELCRRRWQRAREGRGQLVLLHGDAGIGKSRLVAEFRQRTRRAMLKPVVFQCQPRGDTRPLHPFLDPLSRRCGTRTSELRDPDAVRRISGRSAHDVGDVNAEIVASSWAAGPRTRQRSLAGRSLGRGSAGTRRRGDAGAPRGLVAAAAGAPRDRGPALGRHAHRGPDRAASRGIESRPILVVATSREASAAARSATRTCFRSLCPASRLPRSRNCSTPSGKPASAEARSIYLREERRRPAFCRGARAAAQGTLRAGESRPKDWNALREGRVLTLQDLIAARLGGPWAAQAGGADRQRHRARVPRATCCRRARRRAASRSLDDALASGSARGHPPQRRTRQADLSFSPCPHPGGGLRQPAEVRTARDARAHRLCRVGRGRRAPDETDGVAFRAGRPAARGGAPRDPGSRGLRRALRHARGRPTARLRREAARPLRHERGSRDDLLLQLLTLRGPVAAALFGRGGERGARDLRTRRRLCAGRDDQDRAKWFPLYWGWWFTAPDYETQRAGRISLCATSKAPPTRKSDCSRSIARGPPTSTPACTHLPEMRGGGA